MTFSCEVSRLKVNRRNLNSGMCAPQSFRTSHPPPPRIDRGSFLTSIAGPVCCRTHGFFGGGISMASLACLLAHESVSVAALGEGRGRGAGDPVKLVDFGSAEVAGSSGTSPDHTAFSGGMGTRSTASSSGDCTFAVGSFGLDIVPLSRPVLGRFLSTTPSGSSGASAASGTPGSSDPCSALSTTTASVFNPTTSSGSSLHGCVQFCAQCPVFPHRRQGYISRLFTSAVALADEFCGHSLAQCPGWLHLKHTS